MSGDPDDEDVSIVRPYSRTGGRTRPSRELALETLVSTTDLGRHDDALINAEHQAIATLCRETRSVAEVAALLTMPLGVARVLLGDMAGVGLITVHRTSADEGDAHDMAFLERVLVGLRRL
jgi:hypothetical protein